MISASMRKTPTWHPHVLTLSGFAVYHAVYFVPVAAQEFVGALSANGSAVHELERTKQIPALRQQILHQCLSFLFALLKSHCGPPCLFINEGGKGSKAGSAVSLKQARTIVLKPRNSQSHVLVKPLQLHPSQSRMCQANRRLRQTLQAVACPQLCRPQHHRLTTTGSSRKAGWGQYPAAKYCSVIQRLCAGCRAQCTPLCSQCSEQRELLSYAVLWSGTVQIAKNQCW